jgi:hypothetical protein
VAGTIDEKPMPTPLPSRRTPPPPRRDPGIRDVMIAAVLLLATVGLICQKTFPPTPGYSLAVSISDLQLSP